MNKEFWQRQSAFILKLGLFSLIVAITHLYLFKSFFSSITLFFPLWQIYVFHIITVLLIYSVVNYKYSNGENVIFNVFMIGTLIKLVLAILFLLPLLLSDFESKRPDVINFFIPYFFFLAFEVLSINLFLNKSN